MLKNNLFYLVFTYFVFIGVSSISLLFPFTFSLSAQDQVNQEPARTLVTSMGKDVEYRVSRTARHLQVAEVHKGVDNGEILLETLQGDSIQLWVHYSHGNSSRLFGKIPKKKISFYSSGLTMLEEDSTSFPQSRSLVDLKKEIDVGRIQFTKNALIVLGACAVASVYEGNQKIFAQELSNVTGAIVLAGEHQTEPVQEDSTVMIFSNRHDFVEFRPFQEARKIGNQLDFTYIIKTFEEKGSYTLDGFVEPIPIISSKKIISQKLLEVNLETLVSGQTQYLLNQP